MNQKQSLGEKARGISCSNRLQKLCRFRRRAVLHPLHGVVERFGIGNGDTDDARSQKRVEVAGAFFRNGRYGDDGPFCFLACEEADCQGARGQTAEGKSALF